MTDKELTEWEHQSHVITVLTSREMGAWLGRRDSRLLQEIWQEITNLVKTYPFIDHKDTYVKEDEVLEIIYKHIKERLRDESN